MPSVSVAVPMGPGSDRVGVLSESGSFARFRVAGNECVAKTRVLSTNTRPLLGLKNTGVS